MATGTGTGNLQHGINACKDKHPRTTQSGANHANLASSSADPTPSLYTPAGHRALIAIRCARSHRPANMVTDPEYLLEVEMLHPGTIVPSPSTVARDINAIYLAASEKVKDHFKACFSLFLHQVMRSINDWFALKDFDGVVHIQVDGWQSPLVTSFMGVILIWYEGGKIWRVTLEFCR